MSIQADWARADKAAATKVARFEVGKSYVVRSMNDYDSWFRVTIMARTEKTVTTDRGVCRIKVRSNWGARDETAETIKPWGNYSMCPIISAHKEG